MSDKTERLLVVKYHQVSYIPLRRLEQKLQGIYRRLKENFIHGDCILH